jgi:hypothetical protein
MNDRTLVRGLFLVAISLAFGLQAVHYPIGSFARAGAGLFPLMVSSLMLLIGVITVVRSRFEKRAAVDFNLKNIAIILASLCGFAVISAYLNMIAGITFMVFFSSLAASSYSLVRCLKISGLVAVAFAFQKPLGLSLPPTDDVLHNLALGFGHALTLHNLMYCAIGCTVGTTRRLAAWPGRWPPSASPLPLTYSIRPRARSSCWRDRYGAQYGDVSAITMKIPREQHRRVHRRLPDDAERQDRPALSPRACELHRRHRGDRRAGLLRRCSAVAFLFGPPTIAPSCWSGSCA